MKCRLRYATFLSLGEGLKALGLTLVLFALSSCTVNVKIPSLPSARPGTDLALSSVTITNTQNTSYVNTTSLSLSYSGVSGSYTDYCILENDTDELNCAWTSGTLPTLYTVTATNAAKTLSVWIKNSSLTSTRVDSNTVVLDTVHPTITLNSLTGGQTIAGGVSTSVNWSGVSDVNLGGSPISIEVSSDSGSTWSSVTGGVSNSGTYSWSVPSVDSTTYRIRVTATDLAGNTATDASASDFTISTTAVVVTVTSPNGGEVWRGGSAQDITWTSNNLPVGASTADLEYSLNNGSTWNTITTGLTNLSSNTYSWTLPSADTVQARVRVTITDSLATQTADVSDTSFTIDSTAPNAPNGLSLVTPASSPGLSDTPTIRVGGVVSGDTVTLFTDSSCTSGNDVASGTASGVTIDLTTSSLTLGSSTTFYANAADPLGNTSSCSVASVTYDYMSTPTLSYVGASGTSGLRDAAMSIAPTALDSGFSATVQSCTIKPSTTALPAGLTVDNSTCEISGTPTVAATTATYTVLLTNSFSQTTEATVDIEVADYVVPSITSFDHTMVAEGSTLVITGTGFTLVNAVTFNGTSVSTFSVDSATQITLIVPVGATTGTIQLDTSDSRTTTSSTTVTVGTVSVLSLVESPYLGRIVVGTTGSLDLTLKNTGDLDAETLAIGTDLSGAFSWTSGSYPGTNAVTKCATTLSGSNTTCDLRVNFNPTDYAPHGSALTITYFDGVQTQTLSLQIQATGDSLILSAREWDFGTVGDGRTSYVVFRVKNPGKTAVGFTPSLTGDSEFAYAGGSFPGTGGPGFSTSTPACGATIAAESSCDLILSYSPLAPNLSHSGTFTITDSNGHSESATLTGASTTAPSCSCNPADSATFGNAISDGTVAKPYQICSRAHLDRMRDQLVANNNWLNKNFLQCADIDLGGSATPFTPIGVNTTNPFQGTYDGNFYQIQNFYFHDANQNALGFFTSTGPATLKNIILSNFDLEGSGYVGGLVGYSLGITTIQSIGANGKLVSGANYSGLMIGLHSSVLQVEDSYTLGTITGRFYAGGVLGGDQGLTLRMMNSFSLGDLTITGHTGGGLVGLSSSLSRLIFNSHTAGALNGVLIGGLVGDINTWGGLISHSYSYCEISSQEYGGGLVGRNQGGGPFSIEDSSYRGKITASGIYAGGIAGSAPSSTAIRRSDVDTDITSQGAYVGGLSGDGLVSISNSYAKGTIVSSGQYVGGLSGYLSNGSINNSYSAMTLVSGGNDVHPVVGADNSSSSYGDNFFWATEAFLGLTPDLPSDPLTGGITALSKSQMQTQSIFTSAGWDFTSIWEMSGTGTSFPKLRHLGPAIAYFTPTIANVNQTVIITGIKFSGATSVKFNGVDAASFTVVNDKTVTAVVPAGATDGLITVTTPDGTAQSLESWYLPGDVTAPAVPTYQYSYPSSGGTESQPTLCFDPGTIESGATLNLYADDNTCANTSINSNQPDTNGCVSADLSSAEGAHAIYVQLNDASFNYSACTLVKNYSWYQAPTSLDYSSPSSVYTLNSAITPNTPSYSGNVTSFSVFPPLPTGLTLDPNTGVISGTPTRPITDGEFVVTATNGGTSTTKKITITVPSLTCNRTASPYGGGAGTAGNPYLLCSRAHLEAIEGASNLYFKLASDIDLGTTTPWTPLISSASSSFLEIDGDGFDIIHLRVNNARNFGAAQVSSFFAVGALSVQNLNIRDFELSAGGGLITYVSPFFNSGISNVDIKRGVIQCPVSGGGGVYSMCAGALHAGTSIVDVHVSEVEIIGGDYVGGVAGYPTYSNSSSFSDLSFSGKISSPGYSVGGIFSSIGNYGFDSFSNLSVNGVIHISEDNIGTNVRKVGGITGEIYQSYPATFSLSQSSVNAFISGTPNYSDPFIGGLDLFSDSTPTCPANIVNIDASNSASLTFLNQLSINQYFTYGGFCPQNTQITNNAIIGTATKNCVLDSVSSVRRASNGEVIVSIDGKGFYSGQSVCFTPNASGVPYCASPTSVDVFATSSETNLGVIPKEGLGKVSVDCDSTEINVTLD